MRIEISVPPLPESVSDATLLDWHKKIGEAVSRGENLVDLETDKVVLEVPAPEDGVVTELRGGKGDVVVSGQPIAVIDTAIRPASPAVAVAAEKPAPVLSPAARRLVAEHALDPAQITASGREGRLTKQDVLDFLETRAPAEPAGVLPPARADRRVPMSRLRARIAERMLEAQHRTATLTTFNEVNLQRVFDIRNAHKTRFEQQHGTKLGFMSFFVKASVEALRRFPIVNASLDGEDIVYHDYYDIGIAVSTDRGLVVPILRDADKAGFAEIEKAIADFGQKARSGKLSLDELSGGTFTITNGGIFGSMLSTPILNPPQSAILGMHAIKERPMVEDGQIVIRPMIYLALSYDHRVIDGRDAVSFLFTIKELLEDPVRLMLEV
ncbi:2-oxoglutarate dehydrogenase complex dihydrolipoyllysine-residue succinyltransferase [Methylococcus geothermalis]|uniref:Dihydrolipoyllysine-residue succinyltransferase component of 2-oxoglutarate dehydrogenase complex n=1 Tax=Methylococcus geothermalis TaxID=2681310 RepID=A0A858Q805_9GAMM|nr:2-oxoglutarate dehydrogenase complex dihydrolipoyllysine-residue succinyltransferase [Methylococcus geothermalis]QJD29957.1 2-oxoglutarate dehydrogenase complex dihydrolipoyllysine-residue succinyltransferase [Methylococcus geothermalis]